MQLININIRIYISGLVAEGNFYFSLHTHPDCFTQAPTKLAIGGMWVCTLGVGERGQISKVGIVNSICEDEEWEDSWWAWKMWNGPWS